MPNVVSLILGGGQGSRLYPLTKHRSKPAVPVGGKYRLIDIPISNCLNSGFNRVHVLTQFASVSLHRHIANTYRFDPFHQGFVQILAAQQTLDSRDWYQGTADAVRQNLSRVADASIDHVLILSGDQLYRMNFRHLMQTHLESSADVTLCSIPVTRENSADFGILQTDPQGRIVDFSEKPTDPTVLDRLTVPEERFREAGIEPRERTLLANMGIYLFRRSALFEALDTVEGMDFGKHVFPGMLQRYRLHAHLFDGYWEDLGTIRSFHKANLDLAADPPSFEFHVPDGVIFTHARFLPGARITGAQVNESMVADGAMVGGDSVLHRSILGVRSRVGAGVHLSECIMLGADAYESDAQRRANQKKGVPDVGIGPESRIERAIIDKNCRIGARVQALNPHRRTDRETELYVIRDGIVVIPKGTVVPDDTVID